MNFEKKDIMLILAGILLLALELVIKVGQARIDVFSDVLAYVLIMIGISHIAQRNNIFKKCRSTALKGLIIAVAVQILYFMQMSDEAYGYASLFAKGIMTIFFIYFTYYFTEGVALEAKMQDKAAVSRNFKLTWGIFGVFIFGYYIILNFEITDMISAIVQAVLVICAVYYCYAISAACSGLYMEGPPPHSEESLQNGQ